MTILKTSFPYVAMLLVVAASGCKTDRKGPMASLADSRFAALLDATDAESPASDDHQSVASTSSDSATRPIRTLESDDDFLELVGSEPGIVLVDFYADWCGPCRKQSKVLHDVEDYASSVGARIIKVNVDEHRKLARKYQVSSLPTLVVLQDGKVRQTKTGLTSRNQIETMLR